MRVEKTNVVRTENGKRKIIRNLFRKNRDLIGTGYKKVKGEKKLVRMSSSEKRNYNPQTNINIKKAIMKRRLKKALTNLKRKRTLSSSQYKSLKK